MKMKKQQIIVTTIKQTCSACPSQWEGTLSDGKMIYVRYRWGYLSIRVSPGPTTDISDAVGGEEVFGTDHGEGMDGILTYEELTKISNHVIVWPGKERTKTSINDKFWRKKDKGKGKEE